MRVQTEEWRRFIPGVRMYKGKMTYFYNGEKLFDTRTHKPLIYNKKERQKWKVIIVLPGVEIIPERTFISCKNIETVIMADTVRRIEPHAFSWCRNLSFVKFSKNLECIRECAFGECESLNSIFIPDSCRQICGHAFHRTKLTILVLPQHTELGNELVFAFSPLWKMYIGADVNARIKSVNDNDEYGLHRLCSTMDPSDDEIYQMICEQGGPHAMTKKNSIDITPSMYLAANPYADVNEMKLMKRLVLENMGEIVS